MFVFFGQDRDFLSLELRDTSRRSIFLYSERGGSHALRDWKFLKGLVFISLGYVCCLGNVFVYLTIYLYIRIDS